MSLLALWSIKLKVRNCQSLAKCAGLLIAPELEGKQKSALGGMFCHWPSQITAHFQPAPQFLRFLASWLCHWEKTTSTHKGKKIESSVCLRSVDVTLSGGIVND